MRIGCRVNLQDKGEILSVKDAGADYIAGSLVTLQRMQSREITELLHLLRGNDLPLLQLDEPLPKELAVTGEWVDYQKLSSFLPDAMEKASYFCPELLVFTKADYLQKTALSDHHIVKQMAYLFYKHLLPMALPYRMGFAIEPIAGMEELLQLGEGIGFLCKDSIDLPQGRLPLTLYASVDQAAALLLAARKKGFDGDLTLTDIGADIRQTIDVLCAVK